MDSITTTEEEIRISYSLVWGWLHMTNHRYGSRPTGQLQVSMTIIMLCQLGYDPTVTELAEITGLAKSNVSRYVSAQMNSGDLEEYIDSADRRRRKLRPTPQGEAELKLRSKQVKVLYDLVRTQEASLKSDGLNFEKLLENLDAITQSMKTD